MSRPTSAARTLATLFVLAALLGACSDPQVDSDQGSGPHAYTLRGRIAEMPAAPGGQIQLEHEAIHDLVDARGRVVGMDAMLMFFSLAEGAGDGFEVGQIVEFDLDVDWQREPLAIVTRLERLPDDTELVFAAAQPPTQ
jgi:hypothetical protein